MKNWLREPLVHFLVAGLGLFVLFELVSGDPDDFDSRVIDVNRATLLTFVQFRMKSFEPSVAAETLDSLSSEEFERLVDDYIREEALHREALALGLDKNDYIIKRRMIQSIEFITDGFISASVEVSDDELQQFFETNRDDYFIPAYITFTHVFFSTKNRQSETAKQMAQEKLAELQLGRVPFSAAPQHGERFPYFVNYVERGYGFVSSHFGSGMADAVFSLEADEEAWHGPFESDHGFHLVKVTRNVKGRHPEQADVLAQVRADAKRATIARMREAAIKTIIDSYEIRRSL